MTGKQVEVRGPIENLNARGTAILSFSYHLKHRGLNETKELKSRDEVMLESKLDAQLKKWEEKYEKKLQKAALEEKADQAIQDTLEAQERLKECESLLQNTIDIDDAIDWSSLKQHPSFTREPKNHPQIKYDLANRPWKHVPSAAPEAPKKEAQAFQPEIQWFHYLWPPILEKKRIQAEEKFDSAMKKHEQKAAQVKNKNELGKRAFQEELNEANHQEKVYLENIARKDSRIDELEQNWRRGDAEAIHEHSEMVLNNSKYPDWVDIDFEIGYRPEEKMLVINYELPSPDRIPTLEKVSYVKSRDEFTEKHIPSSRKSKLFDSICYQIVLRTIHEIWEADEPNNIAGITFNGFVTAIDPATGVEGRSCIMSVQTWKEEFLAINLELVTPKDCFKKLKGVSASSLAAVQAVPPKIKLDFEDSRFVESREITGDLNESTNLAAMHWEDFEHLIRELFSQLFSGPGAEVKVTQGSRDGGVDAIALDPDPIKGGKIVIQAKRYTNTVGVSAVRDLYGTVVNENANRGILVTTSHYGPDAYQFADGKNLTLIDGGGLLDLLQQHGHKASIDISAAKLLANE